MASLVSYGACQSACNAGAVACYSANGATFGTVTGGAALPAVLVTCNTVLGTCMSTCAAKLLAEGTAESGSECIDEGGACVDNKCIAVTV